MKRIVLALILVFGVSCSTSYRVNQRRSGGYHDQRIDETAFVVKFYGNHSSDLKTRNNLLLRCAILTTEHGYTYFNMTGPVDGNSNEMTAIIRLTNDQGPASYNAVTVQERFSNLVNCGKAKPPASTSHLALPGSGKPCQRAKSFDLLDANS